MFKPKVFVFMAPGFEEMELTISVDLLRRAGIDAFTVTLGKTLEPVKGSREIHMLPDKTFDEADFDSADMVILPGGSEGTENLAEDERVISALKEMHSKGKLIAAICAAPAVLVKAGVVEGKNVTSHPAVEGMMKGVKYQSSRVVVDGKTITSRAAGTTFEFAFKIIEILSGKDRVQQVNKGVLAPLPENF